MALCERTAAKLIPGWPRYMLSHSSAHVAAARLAQPLHESFDSSAADVHAALTSNDRVMRCLNSLKLKRRSAAGGASSHMPSQHTGAVACTHGGNTLCQPCTRDKEHWNELTASQSTADAHAVSMPHAACSDAGLSLMQVSPLDTAWLGEQVTVQLSSSVGPFKLRTKVWSLQSVPPQAGAAGSSTACDGAGVSSAAEPDSQWLQCTTVSHHIQKHRNYKRKKKKKKSDGGGKGLCTTEQHSTANREPTVTQALQAVQGSLPASDAGLAAYHAAPSSCTEEQNPSTHVGMQSAPEIDALQALEHEAFVHAVHVTAQRVRPQRLCGACAVT